MVRLQRWFGVVSGSVGLLVAGGGVAEAQPVTPITPNPAPTPSSAEFNLWDGVKPDFSVLGVDFTNWSKVALGAVWGLALFGAAIFGVFSWFKIGAAEDHGRPDDASKRTKHVRWSLASIGGLFSMPAIWAIGNNLAL